MTLTTIGRSGRLAALALMLGASVAAHAQETIKVGLLGVYSGPSGLAGQMQDNTIKLFQQKYGTTVGGRKIEFIKRDTGGPNPEVAKRLATELITRDKVQVLIGPDFTPNVLAVAPLVTEAKVPAIIGGAATQGIIGEKSPYYVRTFFSIPQVVRPGVQWAWKNNLRKPVLIIADYGPGHDTEAVFNKTWTELGGQPPVTIKIPVRNPEFSGYMQRIKDAQPDFVYVFLPNGELPVQFFKAFVDSGLKGAGIKVVGTGDIVDEAYVDAAGDAAAGAITSSFYSSAHDSPVNKQLVADYTAQFGKSPRVGAPVAVAWDSMQLLYAGIAAQQGQKWDPDKFIAALRGKSFDSPRGKITISDKNGDIIQPIYMRRTERRDGVLVNVEFDTFADVAPN